MAVRGPSTPVLYRRITRMGRSLSLLLVMAVIIAGDADLFIEALQAKAPDLRRIPAETLDLEAPAL